MTPPAASDTASPVATGSDGVFAALFGQQLTRPSIDMPDDGADDAPQLTDQATDIRSRILVTPVGQLSGLIIVPVAPASQVPAEAEDIAVAALPALPSKTSVQPRADEVEPVHEDTKAAPGANVAAAHLLPVPSNADAPSAAAADFVDGEKLAEAARTLGAEHVRSSAAHVSDPALSADPRHIAAMPHHQPPAAAPAVQAQPLPEQAPVRPEIVLSVRPERLASNIGIEVVRQISHGRSEFSIRLDPPDLGRIDVRLEFNRGEVRAVVTSDNPATHDLLRRDAEGLARMLTDNGFRADAGAFRFDLKQDGGQNRFAGHVPPHVEADAVPETIAEPTRGLRRGLLDLFA